MNVLKSILLLLVLSFSLLGEEKLFRWNLKERDILELNENHSVMFRWKDSQVFREDKNRILLVASECNDSYCEVDGTFDTYVRFGKDQGPFQKDKSYKSKFTIKKDGIYEVDEKYIMPNLRNIPSFPEKPVKMGDSWRKPIEESFDWNGNGFIIRSISDYTYEGPSTYNWQGTEGKGEKILFSYTILWNNPNPTNTKIPKKIVGFARGFVIFNVEKGIPEYKETRLSYTFLSPQGGVQEGNFSIQGKYNLFQKLEDKDREKLASEIKNDLEAENPDKTGQFPGFLGDTTNTPKKDNISLRTSKEGITLSLNSILFDHDKSELKPEAIKELERISKIMKKYPEREVRISGHTDSSGSNERNQKLSEDRARAVLAILANKYQIPESKMSFKGYGATMPIDSNDTDEGKKKNRRVDITIMME